MAEARMLIYDGPEVAQADAGPGYERLISDNVETGIKSCSYAFSRK